MGPFRGGLKSARSKGGSLYQWPAAARGAFDDALRRASTGRVLYRVAIEYPLDRTAAAQAWPEAPDELPLIDEISLLTYRDGTATAELLGMCDGWGRRARWDAA